MPLALCVHISSLHVYGPYRLSSGKENSAACEMGPLMVLANGHLAVSAYGCIRVEESV